MNDTMGNGPCKAEKKANRAEILAHAFRLPGEIAYKVKTLKEALSRTETGSEPLTKAAQVDYSSLEAILDDGAGIIMEDSLSIMRDVRGIQSILFDMPEHLELVVETAMGKLNSTRCPETKLDNIKASYNEFVESVEDLRRLQNTVLQDENLPKETMQGTLPPSDTPTSVFFVLHELPDEMISLHSDACDYIRQITEALST